MTQVSRKTNRLRRRSASYAINRREVEGDPGLQIHEPAVTCGGCDTKVDRSRPETRTSYKVYCSVECKMRVFEANGTRAPNPPKQHACPRPDKLAFGSQTWAEWYFKPLFAIPGFNVYRCVCGSWHGGRR